MTAQAIDTGGRLTELRSEFVSSVTGESSADGLDPRDWRHPRVGADPIAGEQRENTQLAVREAKRLARLVDNLLALSRMSGATDAY